MSAPQYIAICYWPKTVTRDAVWNPAEVALDRKSAFDAAQEHLEREGFREPTQVQVIRIDGIEAEDVTA